MSVVAFLDSGVGGFLYLQKFQERQPEHSMYYLADTRGFPYGVKSLKWINNRAVLLSRTLLEKTRCDVIVLSCNTASVVAIQSVRNSLKLDNEDVSVVGVVPAVKLAVDLNFKKIYIMSTTLTASTHYTKDLMDEYGKEQEFVVCGMPKLVQAVEDMVLFSRNINHTRVDELLDCILEDVQKRGADAIVLACTHFLYLKKRMRLCASKKNMNITILDSLDGVVRRIETCLNDRSKVDLKMSKKENSSAVKQKPRVYITSEESAGIYKEYVHNNAMVYGGVWDI